MQFLIKLLALLQVTDMQISSNIDFTAYVSNAAKATSKIGYEVKHYEMYLYGKKHIIDLLPKDLSAANEKNKNQFRFFSLF